MRTIWIAVLGLLAGGACVLAKDVSGRKGAAHTNGVSAWASDHTIIAQTAGPPTQGVMPMMPPFSITVLPMNHPAAGVPTPMIPLAPPPPDHPGVLEGHPSPFPGSFGPANGLDNSHPNLLPGTPKLPAHNHYPQQLPPPTIHPANNTVLPMSHSSGKLKPIPANTSYPEIKVSIGESKIENGSVVIESESPSRLRRWVDRLFSRSSRTEGTPQGPQLP